LKKGFSMRKTLLPLIASLALCGAATGALIATNARADQSGRKPMMIALAGQDGSAEAGAVAPPPPGMMRDMAAHHEQMCKNMYARKVGELAYLEAKLSLNANQAPLFARWKDTSLDIARQHEGDCTTHEHHKPGEHPSVVDRLNMEETMLKKRLADIESLRPSLSAFYDSLTPAQKQEFGHGAGHHMPMMMGMMGRTRPPGMGGRMGHGPMGPGMGQGMGPGPMDGPPPPPPPGQ
jgi:hypothetical protein